MWAEVDRADVVVHAGDWTELALLDRLEAGCAPASGWWRWYGNNDGAALRARLPEVARVDLDGCGSRWCTRPAPATGRERRCDAAVPGHRRAGLRAQPHPVGHHARRGAAAAQPRLADRPPPAAAPHLPDRERRGRAVVSGPSASAPAGYAGVADPTRLTSWTRDGLVFDVRDSGPLDGEAVVCLHGFPQDGTAYDERRAAARGGRTSRAGPGPARLLAGARPAGARRTPWRRSPTTSSALLDAAGVAQAHVVGHDWGGAVAWFLGSRRRDRVRSLTVLSTPHPAAMRAGAAARAGAAVGVHRGLPAAGAARADGVTGRRPRLRRRAAAVRARRRAGRALHGADA